MANDKILSPSNLFIISGPSGAGEDSVIAGLKKILPIEKIVTTTTRQIRPGEKNGLDYYFVSRNEFIADRENNKFFEWAQQYNDNFYGVTFQEIERVMKLPDRIGIWKIEYQGVKSAKELLPNVISIFIYAPEDILIKRIKARSAVTEEFIQERIAYNKKWLEARDIYDYEVENKEGELEGTIRQVEGIIRKHSSIKL